MLRYFFHLAEGMESFPDLEGVLCLSADQISARALKDARAMLAEDMLDGLLRIDRRIEVTDSNGRLVHSLDFASAFSIEGSEETERSVPANDSPSVEQAAA